MNKGKDYVCPETPQPIQQKTSERPISKLPTEKYRSEWDRIFGLGKLDPFEKKDG